MGITVIEGEGGVIPVGVGRMRGSKNCLGRRRVFGPARLAEGGAWQGKCRQKGFFEKKKNGDNVSFRARSPFYRPVQAGPVGKESRG